MLTIETWVWILGAVCAVETLVITFFVGVVVSMGKMKKAQNKNLHKEAVK